jgi:hypothetical protein
MAGLKIFEYMYSSDGDQSEKDSKNHESLFPDPVRFETAIPYLNTQTKVAPLEIVSTNSIHQDRSIATLSLAKNYRFRHLPHKTDLNTGVDREWGIQEFHLQNFLQFGLGIFFYFEDLKHLSILFALLSLISLPSCIMFSMAAPSGNEYVNEVYQVERLSLGWLQSNNSSLPVYNTSTNTLWEAQVSAFHAVSDFAVMLLFFGFIHHLSVDHTKELKKYSGKVGINHYAIEVTGLPSQVHNGHREELRKHFSKFGNVVDISIVRNDMELVQAYSSRGKLITKIKALKLRNKPEAELLKEEETNLVKVNSNIEEMKTKHWRFLAAYVVFNRPEEAIKTIRAHQACCWSCCYSCCKCCGNPNLRYLGSFPKVVRAPEPSNILFENLELEDKARHNRQFITTIIAFACVLLSTLVNFGGAGYSKTLQDHGNSRNCADWSWVTNSSMVDFSYSDTYVSANWNITNARSCFCETLGLDAWSNTYLDICTSFLQDAVVLQSIITGTSFAIVGINYLLELTALKLAKFERHRSLSVNSFLCFV